MDKFIVSPIPELHFGVGSFKILPDIITERRFKNIIVITGSKSFIESSFWQTLSENLNKNGINFFHFKSTGETTPETVDGIVHNTTNCNIDAVIAIGGGTVLDTGKAVSAMLCMDGSIVNYLEGVGSKEPTGKRKHLICIPTTSGTGSEATKNAVITKIGKDGYKKSLRHNGYIPDTVIIDPELIISCPLSLTVATGMDAVTQLLESYVSTKANIFTDQFALYGLKLAGRSLPRLAKNPGDMDARADMAYAAYLSGITLANAGLGVVHGAASVLGSIKFIPHGVVCGTLLGAATEIIIGKLSAGKDPGKKKSLLKFSQAGAALTGTQNIGIEEGCSNLINTLKVWVDQYGLARLSEYGFSEKDLISSSKLTGIKNTPCILEHEDILSMLLTRL